MKRYLTAIIGLLLILFYCSSCSVIKSRNVNKSDTSTDIEVDSTANTHSKSETKITETIDTFLTIRGGEVEWSTTDKDLSEKPFVIENEDHQITLRKDSTGRIHGKVKTKDKVIPVKATKVTEIKSDIKQKVKVKSDKETESKTKVVDKDVKRTGIPWWIWVILVLIVAGYLAYRYLKRTAP